MKQSGWVLGCLMLLSSFGFGQFGPEMKSFSMAKGKFATMAGVPACTTIAPVNGDASKDGYVIALKMTTGCTVPWHWHTGDENLSMTSGHGKVETKEGTQNMAPGDYAYMPAKHPHQFTCVASCAFLLASPQAFDVHYVDQNGNEIPPEQALKSSGKSAGAKKPAASGAKPPSH